MSSEKMAVVQPSLDTGIEKGGKAAHLSPTKAKDASSIVAVNLPRQVLSVREHKYESNTLKFTSWW